MSKILIFKKNVRRIAARLGILRPLRGLVFFLRNSNQVRADQEFGRKFIRQGQLVFDVGANRGQSSETFLALGARVVAFEPQKELHHEIRQVCRNSPNLIIEACGLGEQEESLNLFTTAYDQVASFREDWEGQRIGSLLVEISTLDKQIAKYGVPDYCKIDVEGWELQVLGGLNHAISLLSFEYHLSDKELDAARKVLDRISSLGRYYCNVKESSKLNFSLTEFLPLEEFRARFPYELGISLEDGYGDIYCALKPQEIDRI